VWGIHLSVVHKVSFIKVYIIWTKTTDNLHLYKIRFITFHATLLMSFINIQILEVVRLEGQALTHDDGLMSRDIHLLQLCTGIDEKSMGSCFQLVSAPIDELFPDDAPLISSGFRVIPLDMKTVSFSHVSLSF
jgi:hypothetical protein